MVVTNAPWRLEPDRDAPAAERNEQIAQRDPLVAEREAAELAAVRAERDDIRAQRDALLNSTSSKVTSGLRAIGRLLKRRP